MGHIFIFFTYRYDSTEILGFHQGLAAFRREAGPVTAAQKASFPSHRTPNPVLSDRSQRKINRRRQKIFL